ncbi:hypothetical protein G6F35_010741 [Rhizopus arrhizus]|nr:hypothetical protein G6F35_010741 [Rhizopus arrhizus]
MRVSQSSKVTGRAGSNLAITQDQQSALDASFHKPLSPHETLALSTDKSSQNYLYYQVKDATSSRTELAYERGGLTSASVTHSRNLSMQISKFVGGERVEYTVIPTVDTVTHDLLPMLRAAQLDGQEEDSRQPRDQTEAILRRRAAVRGVHYYSWHERAKELRQAARRRLHPRPGRARAQSEERGCGHPAGCAGGVLWRIGVGKVVAGLRHAVRRSAAALPGVPVALRPAADRPGRRARRGRDRRLASRRGAATAARHGKRAFHGRQRHHPVQHVAHAVFPGRHVSGTPADAVRRGFLAQHAAGGVPQLPWAGLRVRRDREIHGA